MGNPKLGPDDLNVVIKFGGGLHTRASSDEIDAREAADGKNFLIDIQNRNLRPRPPFDLVGTVPNGLTIMGGGSLLKSDGTVTAIFQAGGVFYSWDGHTTFTSVGTCNASSKFRGQWRSHTWNLTDELLLTDLTVNDTVKKWNGTAVSSITFTNEVGSGFGSFYAKYLNVSNERAVFSNIKDGGGSFPHLIIGSARSSYTQITVNKRPSSSANVADPFFLATPDLKPINGHIEAFGTTLISTEKGQIFNLSGSSAQDFAFNPFYPGSSAAGAESISEIGNDIVYGRQGRIESLTDTNTFGNSTASDITAIVADQIEKYTGWTVVFNSRTRLVYCFPSSISEVWVLDPTIRTSQSGGQSAGGQLSPWMRWRTDHALSFQPTFAMSMLNPADGLEYIFMGDASGNIYRMEGVGAGDAGTTNVDVQFLTKLFPARLDSAVFNIEGYIKYQKGAGNTVNLTFKYQGETVFNEIVTVPLSPSTSASYYSAGAYYGGQFFYGQISGQLTRRKFGLPGQSNEFQVLVDVSGNSDFAINEIGLRFESSSK